jgi:ATP-binding cassette subfamily F protein uup
LEIQEADRSGKLVVEARDVSVGFGGRPIVAGLTTRIMRGDRVGLIGPNGSGKTTLLRLLLGQLAPDSGTIRPGTGLEVVYFDQMREQLDPDESIADSVAHGSEWVELGDRRKHVLGYLQDFLFPAERARTPVRALSGGERNRLLLARLFTKSFNVLALDEPTNDLDMETLDLLENLLIEFSGTLLVVSHDRDFLDNVVTSTLVMEGNGRVGEYVGGYADWVRQKPKSPSIQTRPATAAEPFPVPRSPKSPALKRKLSFKETQELAALPDRIERLEQERAEVFAAMSDPVQLKGGGAAALSNRLRALDAELEVAMRRWEELEGLKP